jgi:putative SOS response-associated peptidase YedK
MCGRAHLAADHSETKIRAFIGPVDMPNFRPSWNIAPTQDVLGITSTPHGVKTARNMHWGIIPHWATEKKMKFSTFNAGSEDLLEKKTYAPLWSHGQRCLIVVDGFYEWRKTDKQPFALARVDKEPLVIAGLWGDWKDPASGETLRTCTMLTTSANGTMAALHDRMPAILEDEQWADWLGETRIDHLDAYDMMKPAGNDVLKYWPVSKDVGNVRNHGPHLADPIDL